MPTTAPRPLLEDYYRHFKEEINERARKLPKFRDKPEGLTFDEFSAHVLGDPDSGPESVEGMAEYLYRNRYRDGMPREEFDDRSGLSLWRGGGERTDNDSWLAGLGGWTGNIGKGILQRAVNLVGGLAGTVDELGDYLEARIPLGRITLWKDDDGDQHVFDEARAGLKALAEAVGYEPATTFDEFLESPVEKFIPFAMEHGLVSLPDMAAVIWRLPLYVVARTGEQLDDRLANDRREQATMADFLAAASSATASALLERLAAAKLFGLGGKAGRALLTKYPKRASVGAVAKEAGKGSVVEGITEAAQEGIEQVGAAAGTKRWQEMGTEEIAAEIGMAMAQGAVVGTGFGGAVRGTTAAAQAATGHTEEEIKNKLAQHLRAEIERLRAGNVEPPPAPPGAEGGPAAAGPVPEGPDAGGRERTVDSMQLEEEEKAGKRRRVAAGDLKSGDRVMVDPIYEAPEIAVVEAGEGVVRLMNESGSVVAVMDPGSPGTEDPLLYEIVPERTAAEEGEGERKAYSDELQRLLGRLAADGGDADAAEAVRKMRNDKRFMDTLPPEVRNRIDDLLSASARDLDDAEKRTAFDTDMRKEEARAKIEGGADDDFVSEAHETVSKNLGLGDGAEQVPPEFRDSYRDLFKAIVDKRVKDFAAAPPATAAPPKPEEPKEEEAAPPKPRSVPAPKTKTAAEAAGERAQADEDAIGDEGPDIDIIPASRGDVTTGRRKLDVEYAIADIDALTASNDASGAVNPEYPQALQPRDRARAGSVAQISQIAADIDPKRLGESYTVQEGAPVIAPSGLVESGNARVLGIREAYRRGGDAAEAYRSYLADNYDTGGIENPVLVRVRRTGMTAQERIDFAADANKPLQMEKGASEQAKADARRLLDNPGILDALDATIKRGVGAAGNAEFVRQFAGAVLHPNEVNAFATADNKPSKQAVERIQAALIQAAYSDDALTRDLMEVSGEVGATVREVVSSLAGRWVKLKQSIDRGLLPPEYDQTRNIVDAVNFINSKPSGTPWDEFLENPTLIAEVAPDRQGDRFEATKAFLGWFHGSQNPSEWKRLRPAASILPKFAAYLDIAEKAGTAQEPLPGMEPAPVPDIMGILEVVRKRTEGETEEELRAKIAEWAGGEAAQEDAPGAEAAPEEGAPEAEAAPEAAAFGLDDVDLNTLRAGLDDDQEPITDDDFPRHARDLEEIGALVAKGDIRGLEDEELVQFAFAARKQWEELKARREHETDRGLWLADAIRKAAAEIERRKQFPGRNRDAFADLGITVADRGGVFEITGGYLQRGAFQKLGGRWNQDRKVWTFDSDPVPALTEMLRPAGIPKDTRAELEQAFEMQGQPIAPPVEVDAHVSPETREILMRGRDAGIPEQVLGWQAEDAALIVDAAKSGRGMFLLSSQPGSGKTFVIGAAVRELQKLGHGDFLYITVNRSLIEQNKADIANFTKRGVRFTTYPKMRIDAAEIKASVGPDTVLILDESHTVKNPGKQSRIAADLMDRAGFTILASGTPYENPSEARYLAFTGVFGKPGEPSNPEKEFVEWGQRFGVMPGLNDDGSTVHQWAGNEADALAAQRDLVRRRVYSFRPVMLPENMVNTGFRDHEIAPEYSRLYYRVEAAYEAAMLMAESKHQKGMIGRHRSNLLKRILETGKIDAGVEIAERMIADGRQPVIFTGTKADRVIGRFRLSPTYLKHFARGRKGVAHPDAGRLFRYGEMESMNAAFFRSRPKGSKAPPPFSPGMVHIARAMATAKLNLTLPSVSETYAKRLGDRAALFTGGQAQAVNSDNLEAFLAGRKQALIATIHKGGVGLSLHDTEGDRPRGLVGTDLPWTATQMDQVLGRIARYGMKSSADIEWVFARNIPYEVFVARRVRGRMDSMGAIVRGEPPLISGLLQERIVENDPKPSKAAQDLLDTAPPAGGDPAADPELVEELHRIAARIVPGVAVKTPYSINWKGDYVSGSFTPNGLRGVIRVAMGGRDPLGVLHHESVHALRDAGLFRAPEWNALRREAGRRDWIGRHGIRRKYGRDRGMFEDGNPTEAAYEEAIAEEFRAWAMGRRGQSGYVQRAFRRIFEFFRALWRALSDGGYRPSARSVFADIDSGVIGSRGWRRARDVRLAGKPRMAGRPAFHSHFANIVREQGPGTGTVAEWVKFLTNPKRGIRPAELDQLAFQLVGEPRLLWTEDRKGMKVAMFPPSANAELTHPGTGDSRAEGYVHDFNDIRHDIADRLTDEQRRAMTDPAAALAGALERIAEKGKVGRDQVVAMIENASPRVEITTLEGAAPIMMQEFIDRGLIEITDFTRKKGMIEFPARTGDHLPGATPSSTGGIQVPTRGSLTVKSRDNLGVRYHVVKEDSKYYAIFREMIERSGEESIPSAYRHGGGFSSINEAAEIIKNSHAMNDAEQMAFDMANNPDADEEVREAVEEYQLQQIENERGTKRPIWGQSNLRIPGRSTNYREFLIRAPGAVGTFARTMAADTLGTHWGRALESRERKTIVLHLRVSDRELNGKKTLFVEEVQSDLNQSLVMGGEREIDKQIVGREIPWRGTANWTLLGFKQAIEVAAAEGHEQIAWASGPAQAVMESSPSPEGMTKFMEQVIPTALQRYFKRMKWDVKIEKIEEAGVIETSRAREGGSRLTNSEITAADFALAFPITDAMRAQVQEQGQPKFSGRPTFYSGAARTVRERGPRKASPKEWARFLTSGKNGIRPAELNMIVPGMIRSIDFSRPGAKDAAWFDKKSEEEIIKAGLEDKNPQTLSREEVADLLERSSIKVEVHSLGADPGTPASGEPELHEYLGRDGFMFWSPEPIRKTKNEEGVKTFPHGSLAGRKFIRFKAQAPHDQTGNPYYDTQSYMEIEYGPEGENGEKLGGHRWLVGRNKDGKYAIQVQHKEIDRDDDFDLTWKAMPWSRGATIRDSLTSLEEAETILKNNIFASELGETAVMVRDEMPQDSLLLNTVEEFDRDREEWQRDNEDAVGDTIYGDSPFRHDGDSGYYEEVLITGTRPEDGFSAVPSRATAITQSTVNSHWSSFPDKVPGVDLKSYILHLRSSYRVIDGKLTYFIEEIQSDLHQGTERHDEENFKKQIPWSGTANWVLLGIKHALDTAAHNPRMKQIAWAGGYEQAEMEGAGEEGMKKFQDEVIPTAVNRYLKRMGWDAQVVRKNGDLGDAGDNVHVVEISDEMRDHIQSQGQPKFSRPDPAEAHVVLDNPEAEARYRAASAGVKAGTLGRRIADSLRTTWNRLHRHRELIEESGRNADLIEKMLHVEQAAHSARERIAGLFRRVAKGVPSKDMDVMTRRMILADLLWTSEQGMDLPFGLKDADEVRHELRKVDSYLEGRPDLRRRLGLREAARKRLLGQMLATGVLTERQARNPNYFRHQVLEYAFVRGWGGRGRKVRTPFWHRRRGSEKDINAHYFEAEAEWMFRAHMDVATKRFINYLRSSKYNRFAEYSRRAKAGNQQALFDVLAGELASVLGAEAAQSVIGDARTPLQLAKRFADARRADNRLRELRRRMTLLPAFEAYNARIARALNALQKAAEGLTLDERARVPPHLRPQLDNLASNAGKGQAQDDSGQAPLFELLGHWAGQNEDRGLRVLALTLLGAVAERRSWISGTAIPDRYVSPRSARALLKAFGEEGETAWQPDSYDGKTRALHIFTAKTVPEHIIDRLAEELTAAEARAEEAPDRARGVPPEAVALLLNAVREQPVQGGPKEQFILHSNIAETLNEFHDPDLGQNLDSIARMITAKWKQWVLFNPRRFAKYFLNNMSGDIDAVIANPSTRGIAAKLPRAFKEMHAFLYREREPTDELREAFDRGVIQSSLVMQEITDGGNLLDPEFGYRKAGSVPVKAFRAYFDRVQKFARWRENAVRYAAYLHYREQFGKGRSLEEVGYGASPPWMVEGISGVKDKAARMARDALGDYGNISVTAKWARQRAIPFVSWLYSNTARYNNLFRNAYLYGRDVSAGRGLAMGAMASASLLARIGVFYGMVQLWNHMFFGDDEEQLPSRDRIRMHALLGRDDRGRIVSLRFQGAFSDYLGWMGAEDVGAVVREAEAGRADLGDILAEVAKAPVNKLVQGLNPIFKVPVELSLGVQFYPDYANPRAIRDPWRHVARTFSVHEEFAQLAKRLGRPAPSRPYAETLPDVLLYRRDPGEMAYDRIRGLAYGWLEHEKGMSPPSGLHTKRGQALYDYRRSLRLDDAFSAEAARKRIARYGGTARSRAQSLRRAHPLGMLARRDRPRFRATLSAGEADALRRAESWYRATFLGDAR